MKEESQGQKIDEVKKRLDKLTEETVQMTNQTALSLAFQGEKLKKIDNDANLLQKQTQKSLGYSKQISSFWYYLKTKIKGKYSSILGKSQNSNISSQPSEINNLNDPNKKLKQQNMHIQKEKEDDEDDDKMFGNMCQRIKQAKTLSLHINEQIGDQNIKIDKIEKTLDKGSKNLEQTHKNLKKTL